MAVGCECVRVRHPSYGGQIDFAREISRIYSLPSSLTGRPRVPSQQRRTAQSTLNLAYTPAFDAGFGISRQRIERGHR